MNTSKTAMQTDDSARCLKLKELLRRHNVPFEERQEGNAIVIDIKARGLTEKSTQLYKQHRTGTAG